MGLRLVASPTIAFISNVEDPVLKRRPLPYRRYADDCLVICST